MKLRPVFITPVLGAAMVAILGGLAAPLAHAQAGFNLTADAAPGNYTPSVDTTQYNVVNFTIKGAGGSGGSADSRPGGNGAAGSLVTGLVQVGLPYTSVGVTIADGGAGARGGAGGGGDGTYFAAGGAGHGAGGMGGADVKSGGGGAGGGASSVNVGTAIWVQAGGGGGGGGGSTGTVQRAGYSGPGMVADWGFLGPIDTTNQKVTGNPSKVLRPPSTTLYVTANCASSGTPTNGKTNGGYPPLAADGGGGGGSGGSYLNSLSLQPTNPPNGAAALNGQDGFWEAEGGRTGDSCTLGWVEGTALTVGGGGAFGAGTANNVGLSPAGKPGTVVLTYSRDPKRIPSIPTIDPNGQVTITPPVTLPPGNTPKSYDVTCTSATGATASGSGPAPGPIQLSPPLAAGETYTCTTVAQLQDGTGTPTIKTLPSPPATVTTGSNPGTGTGGTATAVPTLNEWGVIALGLLTAMFGMRKLRRRQS